MGSADAGTPAFEALRALAVRKLPEVESLIERAEEMRSWLLTANDCSCTSFDICALFHSEPATAAGPAAARCASRVSRARPPERIWRPAGTRSPDMPASRRGLLSLRPSGDATHHARSDDCCPPAR